MEDWYFCLDDNICNYRVAGLLIKDNKILVQVDKNNEYAIPGGHVQFNEISSQALIREYQEEVGVSIIIDRLVFVEEVFWKWNNKSCHTIAFYYLIHLDKDSSLNDNYLASQKDNKEIILKWLTFDEIKSLTIYPTFLKDRINNIPNFVEHFVSRE